MIASTTRVSGLVLVSVISVGFLPGGAQSADAEPAATEKESTLRKVVVSDTTTRDYTVADSASATPLSLSLRDTPQSMTVVTRARLDDQKLESLRDVLDNTPGVYSYAYDTERVIFTSRGFTIDNLLYDGVPAATNASTESIDETLDTALYERIEIVRGATGLTSGAGNPAAAVNLVRKHADRETFAADIAATLRRWGDRRIEADVSVPLSGEGRIRGRAVGVYQERDSFQDLYRNERKVFYGVVDADVTDNALLSVGFDYQDNAPRGNTWGSFPLFLGDGSFADWPRSVTTATDWTFWDRTKRTAFAELTHAFANDWSAKASLTWRREREDLALFYVFGYPDPETGEGLDEYAYRGNGKMTERALDLHASGPIELFGQRHELVVGFNHLRVKDESAEFLAGELADAGNFFEWDGSYPEPEFAAESTPVSSVETWQNALYLAGRFVLAEPLKLIAGARYTRYESEDDYLYAASGEVAKLDFDKVIPYAGLIWDVSEQFSLFTSFTGIFKPQQARDENGATLAPIRGRSYEAGVKGEHLDGRLNTALTIFKTYQANVATAVYDPETGEAVLLPDGTQVSRAIDGTDTRGFELEVSGRLREGWRASLGWSHYKLEDADGNAARTFVPRTLVRGFTTWTPQALPQLTIGGGVNWQSKSRTFVGSPDGSVMFQQKDVTLVSLMARYQITPNISVQLNGENLLDKKYYVLDEYDNSYFGTPLSYSLSLKVKL